MYGHVALRAKPRPRILGGRMKIVNTQNPQRATRRKTTFSQMRSHAARRAARTLVHAVCRTVVPRPFPIFTAVERSISRSA
eukprot:1646512-Prymnesium_polylepis.1